MKKSALFLLIFVLLSSCTGNLIVGGPSSKSAIGSAPIINSNTDRAKQDAINNALHQMIKENLKEQQNADDLLTRYKLVEAIVPSEKSGMVKNWSLEDETQKDGFYFVKIRGRANNEVVHRIIADTFLKYGSPRIAVLIEKIEGKIKNDPFESEVNTLVLSMLKDSGLECIDNSYLRNLSKKDKQDLTALVSGNLSLPDKINSRLNADIIIAGTVEISDQTDVLKDYDTNMKSKNVIINIRAIDTSTGRILSAASHSAAGVHINSEIAQLKALEAALTHPSLLGQKDYRDVMLTGKFTKNIISSYITTTVNRKIKISALGIDKAEAEIFYSKILENVYGTSIVSQIETEKEHSTLTLQYAGVSKKLAQEIFDKADIMGYKIKAESIKTDEIIFRVSRI